MSGFASLAVKFQHIHDGVNQAPVEMVFESQVFVDGDEVDEHLAIRNLYKEAKKHGLTSKEIISVKRIPVQWPVFLDQP